LESVKRSYCQKHYINALTFLEEAFLIADPTLEQRTKSTNGIYIHTYIQIILKIKITFIL